MRQNAAENRDERILELWQKDLQRTTVAELVGKMRD
jgi:hypothetical protein